MSIDDYKSRPCLGFDGFSPNSRDVYNTSICMQREPLNKQLNGVTVVLQIFVVLKTRCAINRIFICGAEDRLDENTTYIYI